MTKIKRTTVSIFVLTIILCCFTISIFGQDFINRSNKPFGLTSKSLTSPIFVDIDNDGDLDVFAVEAGMGAGTIYFHENTGTNSEPSYSSAIVKPFGLTSKSLSSPTFVDIDNDGDWDAFAVGAGMGAGAIYYQENTGTNSVPSFSPVKSKPFGLNSKSLSSPTFVDIDNDGDLDAFAVEAGMGAGTIYYQENTGTNSAPSYTTVIAKPFELISKSLTSPIFIDIDNDGDSDVFAVEAGMGAGTIYYQENTGTNSAPAYTSVKAKPFGLISKSLSSPFFADIDNDGVLDAFAVEAGMGAGAIYMYKN